MTLDQIKEASELARELLSAREQLNKLEHREHFEECIRLRFYLPTFVVDGMRNVAIEDMRRLIAQLEKQITEL